MPQTLSEIAEGLEARARELWAEGKREAAWELLLVAMDSMKAASKLLTLGEHSPKLAAMAMTADHREAISRAKTTHPMMKSARKRGFKTQVEVAAAIGIKPNFLSAILKGDKKMPPDTAALLFAKTGYRWES